MNYSKQLIQKTLDFWDPKYAKNWQDVLSLAKIKKGDALKSQPIPDFLHLMCWSAEALALAEYLQKVQVPNQQGLSFSALTGLKKARYI